jgi:hypothetical protein
MLTNAVMALNLYRRHRRDCKAGHPEELRSGEFDERKKGWKRYSCPIFASGTLQGKFKRQTTGQWEWTPAKAVVAELDKARSWDGQVTLPEPLPETTKAHRVTVEHAVKAFLAELQETAAFATHKKYRLLLTKMIEFSEKRGYLMVDQWEPPDVREFRTSWAINPRTGARRMSNA